MKLLIMRSSAALGQLLSLRSEYSSQHPVFKHPQAVFFVGARDQVSHPYKTVIFVILYILSSFLDRRWENEDFGTVW
jgi:hypothetical protein